MICESLQFPPSACRDLVCVASSVVGVRHVDINQIIVVIIVVIVIVGVLVVGRVHHRVHHRHHKTDSSQNILTSMIIFRAQEMQGSVKAPM